MTVANPLVAAQQESESSFWAGTGVGEDISDLSQAIGEGSWVQGSLAGVGLAGDMLFTVTNPIAAGVSIIIGWIIEHVYPLDEMLEQLTGDADAVTAGSQTWANIAGAYTQQATDLRDYLAADMADQVGQAADAWRTRAGKLAGGMDAMSAAAANIAKGLEIAAAIVQFVHDMVRDAISEAIGMFFQAAAEEIFSFGLATPVVVGQISTWVADKVTMLASKAKELVNSFAALSGLLKKIEPGVSKLMKDLNRLDLSDWAANKGTQVGRNIKNHMSGSTPKHHTPTLTATHATARTTSNTSGHSTTSSASGGHGTANSSSSSGGAAGGGSGPGASSSGGTPTAAGIPGSTYHGLDPIHGDTSKPPTSSHGGAGSPAGSSSHQSSHASTGPNSNAAASSDSSYHGLDPIHGDTTNAPSSLRNGTTHTDAGTARADAGSGAESPRAARSGSEGAHASSPDAGTGRAEAGGAHTGDGAGTHSSRTHSPDGDTPDTSSPRPERAPEGEQPAARRTNDTGNGKTGADTDPGHTNPNDTDAHGRPDSDADPGNNRPADPNPQRHHPDEHGKQAPDQHPRDPESPDSEHPKGQEPESVSARRAPEDNSSRSNSAAAETTTPHTKTDDTPNPTTNHNNEPDTDTTHKSNTDTDNDHAKDNTADQDSQHDTSHHHDANDHADADGADGPASDVDDRYQKSVPELFEDRERYINARDELLDHLDDSMPDGLERSAFNVENRKQTIRNLLDDGYDPEKLDELEQTAIDLSAARQDVSETSAAIGEVGGQHYSDTHGAPVLEAWRNENNGHTPPGGYSDGAALSGDHKTFYELEYKGVTAKLSKTPVHTTFEGNFPQGRPAYARDHLITDPRYAQYFHDHKDVWEAIKSGETKLCFRTISTRTAHGEPHVQDIPFDLVGDGPNGHKVRDTLQEMIDALD
ncbi:hypothetical protein [Actinomyces qiguomingii]|uniref:hypothetical protein n=1 Tax=Actinomyces qiguomingii TaxID=2057800 RepID=UPI000CA03F0F|nr:hypothetical protein [Actinomyces qiguomingii]